MSLLPPPAAEFVPLRHLFTASVDLAQVTPHWFLTRDGDANAREILRETP